jgi:hypothetical protein
MQRLLFILISCLVLLNPSLFAQSAGDKLTVAHRFEQDGAVQPSRWKIRFEFSQPVSVLEFTRKTTLRVDDKNRQFTILNTLDFTRGDEKKPIPGDRKVFILEAKERIDSGAAVITLGTGMKATSGKGTLPAHQEFRFHISNQAEILDVQSFFIDTENRGVQFSCGVRLPTTPGAPSDSVSFSPKPENVKKLIKILPPIGKITINQDRRFRKTVFSVKGKFVTGRTYRLSTPGGELGPDGLLLKAANVEFVAQGPKPAAYFDAPHSVIELHSRQTLPVSLVNQNHLRCQLTDVPPFFAPEFLDFTILSERDPLRPTEFSERRANPTRDSQIASLAWDSESRLVAAVQAQNQINALTAANKELATRLAPFLRDFRQKSEVFSQPVQPDVFTRLSLPLTFRDEPTRGGTFLAHMYDPDGAGKAGAARLLQITDLSLTYKYSGDTLLVWVTSLETGKPLPDAEIMLWTKDRKRIPVGRTDARGLIHLKNGVPVTSISTTDSGFSVNAEVLNNALVTHILAATVSDAALIALDSNRFRPYGIAIKPAEEVALNVRNGHVFTERGVYKPGETVFWKATLRKYEEHKILPPVGETVEVSIRNSREDEIYQAEHILNDFGTCSGSVTLKDFAPLGQYLVSVQQKKTASGTKSTDESEQTLAQADFQVQFFERPRHFVEIDLEKKSRDDRSVVGRNLVQEYVECKVSGKYYTGGMVKNAKVRWTAHLVPATPVVKEFPGYQFGGASGDRTLIESGEALLDSDGRLAVPIPLDKNLMSGLYGIEFSATVLDIDGRPATTVSTYEAPAKIRVGMSQTPAGLKEGDSLALEVLVVDENQKRIGAGEIRLDILKRNSFYTRKRDENGNIFYRWENGWIKTISGVQPIRDGRAMFDLGFSDSGSYQIQASYQSPAGEFLCRQTLEIGYSYYYDDESSDDGTTNNRYRSQQEILLLQSKSEGGVNDRVKVDFSVPRPAETALVTIERDQIFETHLVPLKGRHGSFEFTLKPEYRPNVFVAVTIPCGRSSFPIYKSQVDLNLPVVYYGVTQFQVRNTVDKLNIAIQPDMEKLSAHPGEQRNLEFKVSYQDGRPGVDCEMAVCVVDEAVLALTRYITPVLHRLAHFTLPLSVFSGDLRFSLISQELFRLIATQALTGGDGGGNLASDLAMRKDFRPVAYWNPALRTDGTGKAIIDFTLPDTTTAYRIYAVALDRGSFFGSHEREMVVTKEFFLQPSLPRFLTAGDKAVFPLVLANKTTAEGPASVQVAEARNLLAAVSQTTAEMKSLSNTIVSVNLEADNGAGEASLSLAGRFQSYTDGIQLPLKVHPKHLIINRSVIGSTRKNAEMKIDFPEGVADLPPGDLKEALHARLALSLTEWNKIAPSLRYLLQYPYGCIEQTSSGIIPLAGLRRLIAENVIPGFTVAQVDKFLKPGIVRLVSMQLGNGSFGYWPGDREPTWWGTLYATFALTMAKEAGYDVPAERLALAVTYIHKQLFGDHKGTNIHRYGIDELAAVNLAMNAKLTKENLAILLKDYEAASLEGKAYLLWADALLKHSPEAGLKEKMGKLDPKPDTSRTFWYDSNNREIAATLLATLRVHPESPRVDHFAGLIMKALKPDGRWYSTADTGICLLAMADYFKRSPLPGEGESIKVKILQPELEPVEVNLTRIAEEIPLDAANLLKHRRLEIQTANDRLVHFTLLYNYPDPASRTTDLDHGWHLEKTIRNLNGSDEIKVGDIVKVTLEFEDSAHRDGKYSRFEYVAIEDPLPAGMIAINAALKTEGGTPQEDGDSDEDNEEWYCDWEDGAYKLRPDHFEMHDEKVLAFKNRLWSGRFRLSYYARAVCQGEFRLRPSRVSLMYDPEIFGLTTGETVKILPAH